MTGQTNSDNRSVLNAASVGVDWLGDDAAAATADERRVSPLRAAAAVLIERAVAAAILAQQPSPLNAAATIIEVPDADWLDPIAEAWLEMLSKAAAAQYHVPRTRGLDPLEVRRTQQRRAKQAASDTADIAAALAVGRRVVGVAPTPDRDLPLALLHVADLRVRVGRLDRGALIEAITRSHNMAPTVTPTDAEASAVTPADLLLAQRPDWDADACLRRVVGLVAKRARQPSDGPRLDDLHGMQAATRWGVDLSIDLAAYSRGELPWSEVDRGALLAGPSGVGKTTFARALANTCGVALVLGSVAEWQASGQGYLGDMLQAMRRTFDEARAAAPCILFIDEIDGLGSRATYHPRHRDYSVQVLNSMLELLDGVQAREGVVTLAATNRPEALDPALLRPGRLDRVIEIGLPDAAGLEGILRHHLRGDLEGEDLASLARECLGRTGAHVEHAVRAMRRRARRAGRAPLVADLQAELRGDGAPLPDDTRWRIAVHEAGHAVAIAVLQPGALTSVSVPRHLNSGSRLGVTSVGPATEWSGGGAHTTRDSLCRLIAQRLAGRAAEAVLLGGVSAGAGGPASSDLAVATWLATVAMCSLGLAGDPAAVPIWHGYPAVEAAPDLLLRDVNVREGAMALLRDAQALAMRLVEDRRAAVLAVAEAVLERDHLSGREVEEIVTEQVRDGSDA